MIDYLLKRPISLFTIYFCLAILATITFKYLPVSLLPNIDIPKITILVSEPTFSATQIEQEIISEIKQNVLQVEGVVNVVGKAVTGSGKIELEFEYGKNIDLIFISVNEQIDRSMNNLPHSVQRPRVLKSSAKDIPVFYLSLCYKSGKGDFGKLSEFTSQVLRKRLEQLKEVSMADISGLSNFLISIIPDKDKLDLLDLTNADIEAALSLQNTNVGSSYIKIRQLRYLVKLGEPLTGIKEISNISLKSGKQIVKLSEIARVLITEQKVNGMFWKDGRRSISIALTKNSKAKINDLEKEVNEIIKQINREFPYLELVLSRDQTRLLKSSINNLKYSIVLGCILAVVILLIFYGYWKIPIIMGLSIPLSLLLSMILFNVFDLSLNIISLSGVLLGLGLMIDNGIIVLDNITQDFVNKENLREACIRGTTEMIAPLLTSMVTTCATFIPLIFLSGIAGALFYDQALAVSIGLLVSYIVSITFLPVLYFTLFQNMTKKSKSKFGRNRLYYKYRILYEKNQKHPFVVLLVFIAILAYALYIIRDIRIEKLPNIDYSAAEILVNWNASLDPYLVREFIEASLYPVVNKDLSSLDVHIGEHNYLLNRLYPSSISNAHFFIRTSSPETLQPVILKISQLIMARFPEAIYEISPEKSVFEILFPTKNTNIDARIQYTSSDQLENISNFNSLLDVLKNEFKSLEVQQLPLEKSIKLVPNYSELHNFDISIKSIVDHFKTKIDGNTILELESFDSKIPIVISSGEETSLENLSAGKVRNRNGILIPVSKLIKIRFENELKEITSSRSGPYLSLSINTNTPDKVVNFLESYFSSRPNMKIEIGGSFSENKLIIKELLFIMIVAILLLYFIMTAQFESFVQPLIVLVELPVSLAGSVILLDLFGQTINIMSLIGMVVTIGIVINDSIIKLDTYNRNRKMNLSISEALKQASLKRLNPIIMTTLTTILAVLPVLFFSDMGSALQTPLALSVIGGLTVGTLASIFLLPFLVKLVQKEKKH